MLCYKKSMRLSDYAPRPAHLKRLLDSDPAIRWQVMRDLTDETPTAFADERSRIATEGWGAELLARQSPSGNFDGHHADRGLLITLNSLFRSLRTGEVIDERWLRFSYPTFWHYDVLRGLDYLRNAGVKPDSRVREAIETVIKRRHQNGRWPLNIFHRDRIPLEMEIAVGSASRWNTLRSLRVQRWYGN